MSNNSEQPSFHILVCLIKIWTPTDTLNICEEPEEATYITEVENIEIEDSYRKLIGTASVKFPIGTIIKKTTTHNGNGASSLTVNTEDTGAVIVTHSNTKKAELSDFKVGNRIKIWLGYTTDPSVANQFKISNKQSLHFNNSLVNGLIGQNGCLTLMFNGYITKCSLDFPIEIQCENVASVLKKISCPEDKTYKNATVNDLFHENGGKKYRCNFLKDTGLSLHSKTKACDINVGDVGLNTYLTIADIFTEWAKYKIFAFIKDDNGKPAIAVGRTYFSNADNDSIIKYDNASTLPKILFNYHVVENGLTLMNADKAFLAVEASCLDKQGKKFYRVTIRRNPEWNDTQPSQDKWDILNEVTISKKAMMAGATVLGKSKKKVDLSTYTIVPYMSKNLKITHEQLLKEAIKYFESYNMTGIDGTLTLFGDLSIKSGMKVELVDNLRPQKNGYYLVDEVHTTFGTGGYRQKIKLPYCISRTTNQVNNDTK